jgi:hypothetical protein
MGIHPKVETSNAGTLEVYEDGQRVYPCRCGETHRGDYAIYEYGWHNCFHTSDLLPVADDPTYVMCPECGQTWTVDPVVPVSNAGETT